MDSVPQRQILPAGDRGKGREVKCVKYVCVKYVCVCGGGEGVRT